jgi:hypothetical protein
MAVVVDGVLRRRVKGFSVINVVGSDREKMTELTELRMK